MSSETERDRILDRIDQVDLERFDLEGQIKNLGCAIIPRRARRSKNFHQLIQKLQKWMPKSKKQFLRMAKKADISFFAQNMPMNLQSRMFCLCCIISKVELLISTNTDDEVNADVQEVDKVTVTLHMIFLQVERKLWTMKQLDQESSVKMSLQQAKRNLGATLENVWFRFASAQSMTVSRKKLIRLKRIFKTTRGIQSCPNYDF